MRKFTYLVLLIALSIFVAGCSKEKKDEAAQLEKELMGDSQMVLDSAMDSTAVETIDSTVVEPEVEEPVKMMPEKPAGDGFTVQVAGCEDRAYAEHLVEVYKSRGYEPYVTSITVEGQGFYRVRIGIFDSLSDAKDLKAELNDKYSIESWIDVTVNNY